MGDGGGGRGWTHKCFREAMHKIVVSRDNYTAEPHAEYIITAYSVCVYIQHFCFKHLARQNVAQNVKHSQIVKTLIKSFLFIVFFSPGNDTVKLLLNMNDVHT